MRAPKSILSATSAKLAANISCQETEVISMLWLVSWRILLFVSEDDEEDSALTLTLAIYMTF